MAGGQGGKQQFFGIVFAGVSQERWIRRTFNLGFAVNANAMASFVVFIMIGSAAAISCPRNCGDVIMLFHLKIIV